jgi:single-stranded-DNA-specific exonuclease
MADWKIKIEKSTREKSDSGIFHPLVLEILKARGIKNEKDMKDFFESGYENLDNPEKIKSMDLATKRIAQAKEKKEKIAIFGDYDADGVTATALLFETLKNLGFEDVSTYIPDRQVEGYGMNKKALEYLKQININLIITVDCGISNEKEIKLAKEMGIDVIITDHHSIPENIPDAFCIINPHLIDSGFVSENLAGVGVAFKLAQALYKKIDPQKLDYLKWSLDIVAIGTIADCVPLTDENRILVKYGLLVLSKTRRVGLQELFKVGRIVIDENNIPDTHKVGFQIAPRINAAGRMDHASISYNLILEKDRVRSRNLALEVESKNQGRQKITAEIFREVQILAKNSFKNRKIIFAENPHWPVGVLGLVAGRITDEFKKPSAILQKQGTEFTGSLRSIPEVNIISLLRKCSGLIVKFGGHAQAAGVTVSQENITKFYEKLEKLIDEELDGKELKNDLEIDAEISCDEIDWSLINELKRMEPFGEGNEEPVFLIKNMSITDYKVCGNGSKHLKLLLKSDERSPKVFDSIGFGLVGKFSDIKVGDKIDIVFNLKEDHWNGNKKIQLNLIDLKKAA